MNIVNSGNIVLSYFIGYAYYGYAIDSIFWEAEVPSTSLLLEQLRNQWPCFIMSQPTSIIKKMSNSFLI